METSDSEKIDFINFINKNKIASNVEEVFPVVTYISDLLKNGKTDLISQVFKELQLNFISPVVMVTILQTAFPARKSIENWEYFCKRVSKELQYRNFNDKEIMIGFI